MTREEAWADEFSRMLGHALTIEHREGYGWFIVEKGQTLFGFRTRALLWTYLHRVVERKQLYTPTARETYGR
jgi:hypothetical protein